MSVVIATRSFRAKNEYVFIKNKPLNYKTSIVFYNDLADGWLEISPYLTPKQKLWYNIYNLLGQHHGYSHCTKFFKGELFILSLDYEKNIRSGDDLVTFEFDTLGF